MTFDIKEYQRLKDRVDKLQRESDRAEGALDGIMKELQNDYCRTKLDTYYYISTYVALYANISE